MRAADESLMLQAFALGASSYSCDGRYSAENKALNISEDLSVSI